MMIFHPFVLAYPTVQLLVVLITTIANTTQNHIDSTLMPVNFNRDGATKD